MDRIPPRVVDHLPQSNAVRVPLTQKMRIDFSEAMDKSSVVDALFISPAPGETPRIKWHGRELEVVLTRGLQKDQTYVITLGASCKDLRNNKLANSYSFAFSTGDRIDRGSISGGVYFGISPRAAVDLWAYRVVGDSQPDPGADLPDYITQTGTDGRFQLSYLGPGTYRIFAVEDINQDREYEAARELLAVPGSDVRLIGGEESLETSPFLLTLLDSVGPSLKDIDVPDQGKVVLHFDEPLDSVYALQPSGYLITALDDTSSVLALTAVGLKCRSQQEIILNTAPQEKEKPYLISCPELRDLGGNQIAPPHAQGEFIGTGQPDLVGPQLMDLWPPDSALGIAPDAFISLCFDEALEQVSVETSFVLMDSIHGSVAGQFHWGQSTRVTFTPQQRLGHGRVHIITLNAAGVRDRAGNAMEQRTASAWFRTAEAERSGSLSGGILRQGLPDSGMVFVRAHWLDGNLSESRVRSRHQEYHFPELPPGRYLLSAFLDLDENGRFSYGNPVPFVPSEPYWISLDTVMVRSRWETAGVDVVLRR